MLNSADSRVAGELTVKVQVVDDVIVHATSHLERPLRAMSRLLQKQGPDMACQMLPLLFAVCGEAHALAGKLASGVLSVRERAAINTHLAGVLRENLRERLLQLVQYWDLPLSNQSLASSLKEITFAMERGDVSARQMAAEALLHELNNRIRHQHWLPQLTEKLQNKLAGVRLPEEIRSSHDWLAFGPAADIGTNLVNDNGGTVYNGNFYSGQGAAALLRSPGCELGEVLASAVQLQWQSLLTVMDGLIDSTPGGDWLRLQQNEQQGRGWVNTARGWLLHEVSSSQGEELPGWNIQAPTDVNFTGDLVSACLTGMQVPDGKVDIAVRRLIRVLDPCVGFNVEVLTADEITAADRFGSELSAGANRHA